jgi:hypothetical protein
MQSSTTVCHKSPAMSPACGYFFALFLQNPAVYMRENNNFKNHSRFVAKATDSLFSVSYI